MSQHTSASVLILTHNEEKTINGCLASVTPFFHDIVILDSYSTDRTLEVAKKFSGIRVFKNAFKGYASQRMFGLKEIPYPGHWVFMLDADERFTPELAAEVIKTVAEAPDSVALYYVRRMDIWNDKWIKRSSGYPTWFGRLLRIDSTTIRREINEEYHTTKETDKLSGHLIHYPFLKGISYWVDRHNTYSDLEAQVIADNQSSVNWKHLIHQSPQKRRAALKGCLNRMPARPVIVFVYLFLFRVAFLDGIQGLRYLALRTFYELLIDLKIKESGRGKLTSRTSKDSHDI